ncbi:MAG: PorT family protein [Bacteroidetes bacterium]|nr:PorT family protein [Bacteroidota bacterium]
MKKTLLFVCGFFWYLQGIAQTVPDRIYLLDQQVMQVWVDEIGENDILYFTKGQPPRQVQKIARSLVWKVVFANGDTELIQSAPAANTPSAAAYPSPATPETTPLREERARSKPVRYLGLLAGGVATNFYRTQFFPFPGKAHLDWEAGLVGSPVATRFYQARLELLYINKGAVETFQSPRLTIQSESRLAYLQANVLPLILKTGSDRLNFALGAGGYFSYLIQASSRSDLDTGDMEDDLLARQQFDVPTDYGLMALTGLYVRHKPLLEVRYTHGLGQLMSNAPIRVQGVHVTLFLIF